MANPNWKPGVSGNPNGRPPKHRALTEILEKQGSRTIEDIDGKNRNGKRIVARLLWEGVTTGAVTFPGGRKLNLGPMDWKDLLKFLYVHIDGAKSEVDLKSNGEGLIVEVRYANNSNNTTESAP